MNKSQNHQRAALAGLCGENDFGGLYGSVMLYQNRTKPGLSGPKTGLPALGTKDTLCAVKKKATDSGNAGRRKGPEVCPLTCVAPGSVVCIKQLLAAPDVLERLRELGLIEEQRIKLLSRESSLICQVCNARLGISEKLAAAILVEPVAA